MRLANGDGDTAGECLDGRSSYVNVYRCNNAAYQDWTFSPAAGTEYWYVKPRYGSDCLDDVGGSVQGQQTRLTAGCWHSSQWWDQIWYGNWFQLKNYYTGRCLDVRAYGTSSVVQTWPCLNQGNQKWKWF